MKITVLNWTVLGLTVRILGATGSTRTSNLSYCMFCWNGFDWHRSFVINYNDRLSFWTPPAVGRDTEIQWVKAARTQHEGIGHAIRKWTLNL